MQAIVIAGLTAQVSANIMFNGRPLWVGNAPGSVPVFADTAARDAALVSPQNGDSCYVTADGVFYDYQAGAWAARASGATPNWTTTVAGKAQRATVAQINAGTEFGSTGAALGINPADLVLSIYATSQLTPTEKTYVQALVASGTTVVEINQALNGISANVTATNLNTLTAGPTSNANALHTHTVVTNGGGVSSGANGTIVIAHGLGYVPKQFNLTVQVTQVGGNNPYFGSQGSYNGSTYTCLWIYKSGNPGSTTIQGGDRIGQAGDITSGGSSSGTTITITGFDATNVTLTNTVTTSAVGYTYIWDALT